MPQTAILMIGSTCGAVATYFLHKYGMSVVVASCLVGLVGAGLEQVFKVHHLGFVVFGGTFVGMSSSSVASLPLAIVGGALTGWFYQLTTSYFKGFGGRLGTLAFISTVLTFYGLVLLKKYFLKKK